MSHERRRYWPFEVLPSEQQNEQYAREIAFLEAAYAEGYKSYAVGIEDYGAIADNGRYGQIVVRSRNRCWELFLCAGDRTVASALLDDFCAAAAGLMRWLRGTDVAEVLDELSDHLTVMPGVRRSVWLAT